MILIVFLNEEPETQRVHLTQLTIGEASLKLLRPHS